MFARAGVRVFVGTSGWFYDWNEERMLDWYVARSGLDAVELNASSYRFPFPNMVRSWASKGKGLAWSVKVSRTITHTHRFNEAALKAWTRFRALFEQLEPLVHFYLFQLHPVITFAHAERIERFSGAAGLGSRFALEPRHGWPSVDGPTDARNTVTCTTGSRYRHPRRDRFKQPLPTRLQPELKHAVDTGRNISSILLLMVAHNKEVED
jgi:uncharacterized protein YecE (DUF72 family)